MDKDSDSDPDSDSLDFLKLEIRIRRGNDKYKICKNIFIINKKIEGRN